MEKVHSKVCNSQKLSQESLVAMEELGTVLKAVFLRMKDEGYVISDGKMIQINENG